MSVPHPCPAFCDKDGILPSHFARRTIPTQAPLHCSTAFPCVKSQVCANGWRIASSAARNPLIRPLPSQPQALYSQLILTPRPALRQTSLTNHRPPVSPSLTMPSLKWCRIVLNLNLARRPARANATLIVAIRPLDAPVAVEAAVAVDAPVNNRLHVTTPQNHLSNQQHQPLLRPRRGPRREP